MKFEIETKALEAALRIASTATMTARSTLPILGNILIEAKEGQLILSTTNLDIHVRQKLSAKITQEGATTAAFSILSQLVSRMQSSSVSIEQQKDSIQFKCGEVVAELETLDAGEFPGQLERSGIGIECEAEDITKPFTMISHAISQDASRYALMGINVNARGEFTATDGRRIALFSGVTISEESVIIPDVFIRAMMKIDPKGLCEVFIGNGAITLVSQDIEICSKLIEATFPDGARRVMADFKSDKALSCGRKPLIHALQTCSIFSPSKNPGLYIAGKGKEIEVSQPGKAQVSVLGTELSGQPKICLKLNEQFLIQALEVLAGDDVRLRITDGTSPVMIEEGKFKEIIMPMRVQ